MKKYVLKPLFYDKIHDAVSVNSRRFLVAMSRSCCVWLLKTSVFCYSVIPQTVSSGTQRYPMSTSRKTNTATSWRWQTSHCLACAMITTRNAQPPLGAWHILCPQTSQKQANENHWPWLHLRFRPERTWVPQGERDVSAVASVGMGSIWNHKSTGMLPGNNKRFCVAAKCLINCFILGI